jgi:rSAM/selenodomain-associated transferase 1
LKTAILLFVKYPEPGKVKTRLAAQVGSEEAARIYCCLVAAICESLPEESQVIVAFDPPQMTGEIEQWLRPLLRGEPNFTPQKSGDLGARLSGAFDEVFASGFQKVAVIGSDCVEVTDATFAQAWRALETCDCAVGPSNDGGYYLLALREPQPALFEGIVWSSDQTLAHTLARAREQGLSMSLLPSLNDVDTENDWIVARRHLDSRLQS